MSAPRRTLQARRDARTVVTVALLAVVVGLALRPLADVNRADPAWDVRAVEVIGVAAQGAPVTAFVDAVCERCQDPLLQLRVCPGSDVESSGRARSVDDATCDVASRRAPSDGVSVLRYGRGLEPGPHRVEVLFLARDRLGASRSFARVEAWVDVR